MAALISRAQMSAIDRAARLLLRSWVRNAILIGLVISVAGIVLTFKANYSIITKFENVYDALSWSAFTTRREFNQLKYHAKLYEYTKAPAELEEIELWLDILFNRVATFKKGQWSDNDAELNAPIQFASQFDAELKVFEQILRERKNHWSSITIALQPTIARIDQLITNYLNEVLQIRIAIHDRGANNARQLLVNQQYLIIAILFLFSVLIGLAWLRSRQAIWLSTHDPLTSLANRPAIMEKLKAPFVEHSKGDQFAVFCIDLDRFKMVNDTLGHRIGDELLMRFGQRLQEVAGAGDIVARTGGNQFMIIGYSAPNESAAQARASTIISSMGDDFIVGDHQLRVGVSVGFSLATEKTSINEMLMEKADLALYEAKRRGGNNAVMFDPALEERAARHRRIDTDLRKALEGGQFVNYYQPKIDLVTRRVCGAEALIRWFHPHHGMVRPDHFIPIAEETRLIIPIGVWAANQACVDGKLWSSMIEGDFHIAVNLSPVQFESRDLVAQIKKALDESQLDPSRLELEITESTLMEHSEGIEAAIQELRDFGVRFALDDFGTGFSSLSYLEQFRFDKVKIDRSFINGLNPAVKKSPIIEAVVHMGRGYDFDVCAEGIEDEALASMLHELGCDEAQGYYFGKPMPASEFTEYLKRHPSQNVLPNNNVISKIDAIHGAVAPST